MKNVESLYIICKTYVPQKFVHNTILYDTSVTYFSYSGQLADRSNLRYYLTVGMLGGCGCNDIILHHQTGSAMSTSLLGLTYFFNIHQLFYFILVQVCM